MNVPIDYLVGCYVAGLEDSREPKDLPLDTKNDKVAELKKGLEVSVQMFDEVRNSYLEHLEQLRDVYKPTFQALLTAIKEQKAKLEELTDAKVKLDE